MQQNTSKWLDWRNMGIGSSDVPIILGVSPYMTPFQLWEIKTGIKKKEDKNNFITDFGHKFEGPILAGFNLANDFNLEAMCSEHDEFSFLRCSFDGLDEENKRFAEIKMVGEDNFNWVKENKKPLPHHEPQTDHQQFMAGDDFQGYYGVYTLNKERTKIEQEYWIELKIDKERIESNLNKVFEFWDMVKTKTAPPKTKKDFTHIKDKELNKLSTKWARLTNRKKEIEKELKEIESKLKQEAENYEEKIFFRKCSVQKIEKKGSIDYSKLDMDLEHLRKPSTSYYKISEVK